MSPASSPESDDSTPVSLATTAPKLAAKAHASSGGSAIPVSLATTAPSLTAKAQMGSGESSRGISLAATATADPSLAATSPADSSESTHPGASASTNLARGTVVSRYIVLSTLGTGGMGVVFAAHDPELDRKVALKLLHPQLGETVDPGTTNEARVRLLREAQALAKLNHPHIVAVHDAGEHEGSVWLAMEYVEGATVGAWLSSRRRTWREVLMVITPAIHGLLAAHEVGLVHRDIKPDNIMVGDDGRVRVMDLGLARALGGDDESAAASSAQFQAAMLGNFDVVGTHVTRVGAVMGTPAYMSPEQFRGERADARSDVFSLCVTLWEALYGERPFAGDTMAALSANVLAGKVRPVPRDPESRRVPAWLRRVCLQGLAVEPERRFESMWKMLEALSRGRKRSRIRKWLFGAAMVATVAASGVAYQRYHQAERVAACEQTGARIFTVWSDEARADVRAGILATGESNAPTTADKVMPFLDGHAESWRKHTTEVCLAANVEETLSEEHLNRATWCLDERRMGFAALVHELSRADGKSIQTAVVAAASLEPVSNCTNEQVITALPPPPPADVRAGTDVVRRMLAEVRALLATGKYTKGLEQTRNALTEAETLQWPPTIAAARQLEGRLLEELGKYDEAEAASLAAYMQAAKVHAWGVAAVAANDLVHTVGHKQARHSEGKVWAGHAEVVTVLAGDPMGLSEARRIERVGTIYILSGNHEQAKPLFEQALGTREQALGSHHPNLFYSLNHLATIHQAKRQYPEAKAIHERAVALLEHTLGPDHPRVAASLSDLANVHKATEDYREAKILSERALTIRRQVFGPDHPDVATSLNNLATLHYRSGNHADAKDMHRQALAIREQALAPDHPDVAVSLNNLATVLQATGDIPQAVAMHERALSIREKALGPSHAKVADSLTNLANLHVRTGEFEKAKRLRERVVAILEKNLGPNHSKVSSSVTNLAEAYEATGNYTQAKAAYQRVLSIRKKALGADHPKVASSLSQLAGVEQAMGNYTQAKALDERVLAIRKKALGSEHSSVATTLTNLANLHKAMGEYDRARVLGERALAINEKAHGPKHTKVALCYATLGQIALAQDQPEEALSLLERAMTIYDAREAAQEGELSARFALAKALIRTGTDRPRALAEAGKAAEGLGKASLPQARELGEVEAFLAKYETGKP